MSCENFKKVKRVLWIILFLNLGVAVLKIIMGNIIKSSSMTADGFHSLADGSSNIVGIIGISLAAKPVDKDHPYGHRKFETLSSLAIAGMLVFVGGKIIYTSILRFVNPVIPQISTESLITLIVTLAINIFVTKYEYKQGQNLNSYILISDSMHTKSDIYVTIGVLFTLICVKLGIPPMIDSIASLVVSGFILHAAYEIFQSASGVLVDKAMIDEEQIKEIAMEFEQIKDVHNIRSRGSENDIYVDMHIMTEPGMSVEESHVLVHDIEKSIKNKVNNNIQVIFHVEPFRMKKSH